VLDLSLRRLYFVTGKGGTGKTSACVGLARALARRGRRVLLLEVDAPRPNLPSYFGGESSYEPRVLAPRIEGANIDFYSALRSYVESVVPVKSIVRLILRNKVVRIFLSATPGARELVILSRIWEHSFEPRWDHIVVDLPASGHAVALFRCPFLAQQTFDRGPLRKRAGEIAERFTDPEVTSLLFCALPGEMPINETLETRAEIIKMGLPPVGGVLLNRYPDERFTARDEQMLEALIEPMGDSNVPPRVREAVEAAREVRREQGLADEGLRRLREAFGDHVESLPLLPGTHSQVADALSLMLAEGMR
jgi:anion-transporting  ArsA/GET3 family ATPase